jgi:hypothetical protein
VSKRARHGHRPTDMSSLREAMQDNRVWSAIGVVRAREGSGSHWEKDDELGDVVVDVDLGPDGMPAWCRLAGGAGDIGVWRVPPPDTEVLVSMPAGDPRSMPTIVRVLSSGTVPSAVDGDVLLVTNTKKLRIVSTTEDVEVEAGPGKTVKLGGGAQAAARADKVTSELSAIQTAITGLGGSYTPSPGGVGASNVKIT